MGKIRKSEDRCICCGEIIPEGRQVCVRCEKIVDKFNELGHDGPIITSDELRKILSNDEGKSEDET